MRTLIIISAAIAATGCTEKPVEAVRTPVETASRATANALVEQSTRMMQPVNEELQKGLMTWGEDHQRRMKEIQERIKHGPPSAPIRECIIDGVKTFDNRGNLCPDEP